MKKLIIEKPFIAPRTYLSAMISVLDTHKSNTRKWIYKNLILPYIIFDNTYSKFVYSGLGGETFPWLTTEWLHCPFFVYSAQLIRYMTKKYLEWEIGLPDSIL